MVHHYRCCETISVSSFVFFLVFRDVTGWFWPCLDWCNLFKPVGQTHCRICWSHARPDQPADVIKRWWSCRYDPAVLISAHMGNWPCLYFKSFIVFMDKVSESCRATKKYIKGPQTEERGRLAEVKPSGEACVVEAWPTVLHHVHARFAWTSEHLLATQVKL